MPFRLNTWVGPIHYVLDGVQIPMGMGNFEGGGQPIVKYRDILRWAVQKTSEPIEMSFGLWARIGQRNHILGGVQILHGKGNFEGGKGSPL